MQRGNIDEKHFLNCPAREVLDSLTSDCIGLTCNTLMFGIQPPIGTVSIGACTAHYLHNIRFGKIKCQDNVPLRKFPIQKLGLQVTKNFN